MKTIKLLQPYTKSKVKMYWQKHRLLIYQVGKYDAYLHPPYEYLEVYKI